MTAPAHDHRITTVEQCGDPPGFVAVQDEKTLLI